jgi:nitroimidazol reductase NimA-like FMN-containing flavoprotein (pyridoxamine 5'-phosphate oxidase superfamily)
MRRKDREITEFEEIKHILTKGLVCRIALSVDDEPYIVPLNYGVEFSDPMVLYFHCATAGRKIEMLKKNNRVCFEIEVDTKIVHGEQACDWSMNYKSVIGYGRIEIISDEDKMIHGLNVLMEHYAGKADFSYKPKLLKQVRMLKLKVDSISGKSHAV